MFLFHPVNHESCLSGFAMNAGNVADSSTSEFLSSIVSDNCRWILFTKRRTEKKPCANIKI